MCYLRFVKKISFNKTILIVIAFFVLSPEVKAQFNDSLKNGVFITTADFTSGKLFPETGSAEIKDHLFLNNDYIEVFTTSDKFRFHKDSIYGYIKNNNIIRIYGKQHQEFIIADTGSIVIYKTEFRDPYKKNSLPVDIYYFSIKADSEIFPLTIAYLKKVYEDNCGLCIHLETNFNDATLSAYDEIKKKYKINLFLEQFEN